MTTNVITLEQVEELATKLSLREQLKLLSRLSERLIDTVDLMPPLSASEQNVAAILSEMDAAAAAFTYKSDSVATIQHIREERHAQWQSES